MNDYLNQYAQGVKGYRQPYRSTDEAGWLDGFRESVCSHWDMA